MPEPRRALVVYAHPYPRRSRAGRALLAGLKDLPSVTVRSLYDLYPDFDIDVGAEQAAVAGADVLVWQCPFYWYGVPAMLGLWFEKVLTEGWAYGTEGEALVGKRVQWVTTTGTSAEAYRPRGIHGSPFDAFVAPIERTARFCGMSWEPPIVLHDVHRLDGAELAARAAAYRLRVIELTGGVEERRDA